MQPNLPALGRHGAGWVVLQSVVIFVAGVGVFWLKSIREEAWLCERYPEYDAYRRATRFRFLPGVF